MALIERSAGRMIQVVALVHEESGGFGISFPDFQGCVSGGDTLEEALVRGQATLAFHVEGMVEDGDPLPKVRTFDELRRDRDFRSDSKGAIVTTVPLDVPGKAVR
jgi:predicted RNase H-like HicB family nuclease